MRKKHLPGESPTLVRERGPLIESGEGYSLVIGQSEICTSGEICKFRNKTMKPSNPRCPILFVPMFGCKFSYWSLEEIFMIQNIQEHRYRLETKLGTEDLSSSRDAIT